jgi:hypothetical protein
MPLGQAFTGTCTLPEAPQPTPEDQLHICNNGYARGRCPSFPASEPIDAFRFAKTESSNVLWIEESAHRPVRFGEYTQINGAAHSAKDQQAAAFARSIAEGKIN